MSHSYDTLIQNARVFNNGEAAITEDIAIKDGSIVKRGQALDASLAVKAVDPNVKVLTPGFVWWQAQDPDKYVDWMNSPTGTGGVAGEFCDGVSGHSYDSQTQQQVSQFIYRMEQLKYVRDNFNPVLPIFQTEAGLIHGSYLTPAQHAVRIKRMYLAGAGFDLKTNLTYSADGSVGNGQGGLDLIGDPSYNAVVSQAIQEAYDILNNNTIIDVAELATNQIYVRDSQLREWVV